MVVKFNNLESLRGIAAICVALYHAPVFFAFNSLFYNQFIYNSWIMVDFFFVLSGFVISLNYWNKLHTYNDLFLFQKKRFFRLYPLHIATLLVCLFIEFLKYIGELKFNILASTPAFSENNLYELILNILLIHSWVNSNLTFNFPSWSISAEFYVYFLFGLLVYIFKNYSKYLFHIVLILLFSFALISLLNGGIKSLALIIGTPNGPIRCIFSFFIGFIIYQIYININLNLFFKSSFFLLLTILLNIFFILKFSENNFFTLFMPVLFGFTILFLVCSESSNIFNKLLNYKFIVYLGTISYGIYMIHAPLWWFIKVFLEYFLHFPTIINNDGGRSILIENIYLGSLINLVSLILLLITAHYSYKKIELKFYLK